MFFSLIKEKLDSIPKDRKLCSVPKEDDARYFNIEKENTNTIDHIRLFHACLKSLIYVLM